MVEVHNTLRTFYQSEDSCLLAAESPPQLRTIKVQLGYDEESPPTKYAFYLSFPYIQFYLTAFDLHLSFSKKPVLNIKDEICFPFLPNVYSEKLDVCLGVRSVFREEGVNRPNKKVMEKAVEKFWNTGFYVHKDWYGCWAVPEAIRKNDLNRGIGTTGAYKVFCGKAIDQFEAWEEGSRKEGVDFISNLEWPHAFKDLPDLLKSKKNFVSCLDDPLRTLASFCG